MLPASKNKAQYAALKRRLRQLQTALQTEQEAHRQTKKALHLSDNLNRAEELADAQTATIKHTLEMLASGPDLQQFVRYVIKEIATQLETNSTGFFLVEETLTGPEMVMKEHLINGEFTSVTPDKQPIPTRWTLEELSYRWTNILIKQGKFDPVIAENAASFWPGTFEWFQQQGHQIILSYILYVDTQPIGYLGLCYRNDNVPDEKKRELGQALVHQLTLAVQLSRLAEEAREAAIVREQEKAIQERASQLAKANEILKRNIAALGTQSRLDSFLTSVMQELNSQLNATAAYLFLFNNTNQTLNLSLTVEENQLVNWRELPDVVEIFSKPIPYDASIMIGRMFKENRPLSFDHLSDYFNGNTSIYWPGTLEWHLGRGHIWAVIVPLALDQQLLGMLGLAFKTDLHISEEQMELVQALANQVTLALQLTRLAERERQEATQSAVLQERNRMAREIHDTLAQTLTGIIVQLQAAGSETEPSETYQAHLEAARQLAKEGLTEARRSVWALRPQALEGHDLPMALENIIKKAASVYRDRATKLNYQVEGLPYLLPPALESQLLRIGQEALSNALKYAEARQIEIRLAFGPDGVSLRVKDDGIGFDPAQPKRGCFGLTGMRERAEAIQADLMVDSRPGQGCCVTLVVPIKPD